jgi:hypothetical protein
VHYLQLGEESIDSKKKIHARDIRVHWIQTIKFSNIGSLGLSGQVKTCPDVRIIVVIN